MSSSNSVNFAKKDRNDRKNTVSEVQEEASAMGEHARQRVGEGLEGAAKKLHDNAPSDGRVGEVVKTVADKIEQTGEYIKKNSVRSFGQDCSNMIRRHPVQAALVGLGAGVLIARASKRRAQEWTAQNR